MAGDTASQQKSTTDFYKKPMGKLKPTYEKAYDELNVVDDWSTKHPGLPFRHPLRILRHIKKATGGMKRMKGKSSDHGFSENQLSLYHQWVNDMLKEYRERKYSRLPDITTEEFDEVFEDILAPWFDEYQITDTYMMAREEKGAPMLLELTANMFDWTVFYMDGAVILVLGPPRGGKTNSGSFIARKVAGRKLDNGATAEVISNIAFYKESTLDVYPHIHYSVRTSEILRMIGQGKIDHADTVKYLLMWDEADAVINATSRLGKIIGDVGILFKQMGKFGVTAYLIFKNITDVDKRFRDKASMPGGTVGFTVHMGAYPQLNPYSGEYELAYYKGRAEKQHHMLIVDSDNFYMPPLRDIPNEAHYYQHDMITTMIFDTDLKKFAELCMGSRPAKSNHPAVLKEWHRDQGHFIMDFIRECRLSKDDLDATIDEQVLMYLNGFYKDRISRKKGTWVTASDNIFNMFKVKMSPEECEHRWRDWRTSRQGWQAPPSQNYFPGNNSSREYVEGEEASAWQ